MRTNLQKRFGIVRDVREVECPFGPGIFFSIRREGHSAVRAWAEKAQAENPVLTRYFAELTRAQTKQALIGKGGTVNAEEIAEKVFADANLQTRSVSELIQSNLQRLAVYVEGWRGLSDDDGSELPFSEAALLDLFRADERLGENEPFAVYEVEIDGEKKPMKRSLGQALQAWVEKEAKDGEAFIEAVAKNFAASSGGESAASNA